VRHAGADMPVYIRGNLNSGVILLIVHGGPGGNGLEYRTGKYTVELEQKYAVAYWDQRGQGMSQGHYNEEDVTIAMMADDMNAVVNVLKEKYGKDKSIFALGHSWGGTLTSKYMITKDYQFNLKGWIEADGAHDLPKLYIEDVKMFLNDAGEQIQLGNSVNEWTEIQTWASQIDTNNITYDLRGEIYSKSGDAMQLLSNAGFIESGGDGGNYYTPFGPENLLTSYLIGLKTYTLLEDEVEQYSATDDLYKVEIPTLVLWGKHDYIVPPALAYDTYNNISSQHKKIVIFEHSGHSPMDNVDWEDFTNEIVEFIETYK